jgi:hypothetical protein
LLLLLLLVLLLVYPLGALLLGGVETRLHAISQPTRACLPHHTTLCSARPHRQELVHHAAKGVGATDGAVDGAAGRPDHVVHFVTAGIREHTGEWADRRGRVLLSSSHKNVKIPLTQMFSQRLSTDGTNPASCGRWIRFKFFVAWFD